MEAHVTFADVIQQEQGEHVILLLYKEAEQVIGIWTGFYEGTTLAWIAAGRPNIWGGRRLPGVHEFLKGALDAAGAKIAGTVIHSLDRDVFIGDLEIRAVEETARVDARPADAIALAQLGRAPIRADLNTAAISSWNLEAIYHRTTIGRPTQNLVDVLGGFWKAQDAPIYHNCTIKPAVDAAASNAHTQIRFIDVLGKDPVAKTAVFWAKTQKKMLPIRVPAWEADTLAWLRGGRPWPEATPRRPQTHQLAEKLLASAGVAVKSLRITDLQDQIFGAAVETEIKGEDHTFPIRPVDAAALSLALKRPISASDAVIEAAGERAGAFYRSKEEVGTGIRSIVGQMERALRPQTAWRRIGAFLRGA